MEKSFKASEILGIKDPGEILRRVREWSSDLSEEEYVIKSVVQEIQQNCEIKLDKVIYKLLVYCTPKGETKEELDQVEEDLWKQVGKIGFVDKYRLLKPILKNWQNVRPEMEDLMKINDVRRECTHLKDKNRIDYKGHKIFSDPEGIAQLFVDAWGTGKALNDLGAWIEDQQIYRDKALEFARENKGI